MFELLHYDFFQNALLATLFTGITCGLVGTYIVARRMVFISGGITHASFGGLGLAYYAGIPPMCGATLFSLLAALGIQYLGGDRKLREDSLIGIFWSAGMALGILFIYHAKGIQPYFQFDRFPLHALGLASLDELRSEVKACGRGGS